jgi:hypothetical protein
MWCDFVRKEPCETWPVLGRRRLGMESTVALMWADVGCCWLRCDVRSEVHRWYGIQCVYTEV